MQAQYVDSQEAEYANSFERRNPNADVNTREFVIKPLSLPQLPLPRNPDDGAETRELLIKPLSLPSFSDVSQPERLLEESYRDPFVNPGHELWNKLTERLETVDPRIHGQSQASVASAGVVTRGWDPHFHSTQVDHRYNSGMFTIAHSTDPQKKKHAGSRLELIGGLLSAGVVIGVYMVTPLVTTLIPVLPSEWGRILIALEILGLSEFAICRILMKTTQNR